MYIYNGCIISENTDSESVFTAFVRKSTHLRASRNMSLQHSAPTGGGQGPTGFSGHLPSAPRTLLAESTGCRVSKTYAREDIKKIYDQLVQNDYSKTEYKGTIALLTIISSLHGEFQQKASGHLNGNGCQICARMKMGSRTSSPSTTQICTEEGIINKLQEVHGGKYDLSKVRYINRSTKVTLTCAEHGEFQILTIKCNILKTRML